MNFLSDMPYTIGEIKVHAYNFAERQDYTVNERNLFLGLAYCYQWFKLYPEDKDDCMKLMNEYIDWFNRFGMKGVKSDGG